MPVQTLLGVLATERYTDYCVRRHGAMVTLRIAGLGRFVSVADPELIKALFTGDRDVLRAGEANAALAIGDASVVTADGDRHLRLRRLLLPPLHGEAIQRSREVVAEVTAADVERWPRGRAFPVLPRMQAVTLEVILRAVLGVRDAERTERLRGVLPGVLGAGLLTLLAERANPRLFARPQAARLPWIRARHEAQRLLAEEIAAHRDDPGARDDVLGLLMAARDEEGRGLTDEDLRDQLLTLLVAGHETTATALAWCFERLVRHPAALARLRDEVRGGEGDAYLDAVVDETLRVRPVLDQVQRRLATPVELGGHVIPAGTVVAASIIGVQRSAAYDEPAAFRPERFLGTPAPPYSLIPFGGGTRRCLGASFALMEMKTVLRTALERVDLEPAMARGERPSRGRRFTTVPARGGRVVVR